MTRNTHLGPPPDGGEPPSPPRRASHLITRRVQLADRGEATRDPNTADVAARADYAKVLGDLARAVRALAPVVLQTETIVLDGSGAVSRQFKVPYSCVAVDSNSAALLTLAAATLGAAAPASGPGVANIKPRSFVVANLSGYAWTLYGGSAGEQVTIQTLGRPQTPLSVAGPNPLPFPAGAVAQANSSGNVANAAAVATLPAVAGQTEYISGFELTAAGATAALAVTATVAGLKGGTLSYTFVFPTGATVGALPLTVEFDPPLPASAPNTAITVTLPASGAGGTNATASAHGYSL